MSLRRRAIVALCATASLMMLGLPTSSHAQSAPSSAETKALAETLFFAGRGLMEVGRYHDACLKFEESYRLDAAAGTLLNMAVCHEKEGRIASAWGEFKQALVDAKKVGRTDRIDLATERLAVIEPELPKLTITVPSQVVVPSLEIVRNGVVFWQGAWNTELPVDPGTVRIVVRAPGYVTKEQTIDIAVRETKSIEILPLERAPEPMRNVTRERVWSDRKTIGLVTGLLGISALAVGATFGALTITSKRESDAACPLYDGQRRCTQPGVDAMARAQTFAWVTDVTLATGIAAAGLGAWWFFTGPVYERARVSVNVRVEPTLGGAALILRGAF